ncbi:hypothetical protein KCU64_g10101, partial [Aureobasidium melanogenum]
MVVLSTFADDKLTPELAKSFEVNSISMLIELHQYALTYMWAIFHRVLDMNDDYLDTLKWCICWH